MNIKQKNALQFKVPKKADAITKRFLTLDTISKKDENNNPSAINIKSMLKF